MQAKHVSYNNYMLLHIVPNALLQRKETRIKGEVKPRMQVDERAVATCSAAPGTQVYGFQRGGGQWGERRGVFGDSAGAGAPRGSDCE